MGGALGGVLNMSHNRITNLPKATGDEDATSVTWVKENTLTPGQVEAKITELIPKGLWGLMAYVKGSPSSHTVEYKSDDVLRVTYRKVTPDTQLIFSFKNDLPDGLYAYDFDIRKKATSNNGVLVYLWGECGGSGYDCKLTYRFWGAQHNQSGQFFSPATKSSGKGGKFLEVYGSNVQVHGIFELRGNDVYNHGRPYTLTIEGDNGECFEVMNHHLSLNTTYASGNQLIGSSLNWTFEPKNNGALELLGTSEFKLFKLG